MTSSSFYAVAVVALLQIDTGSSSIFYVSALSINHHHHRRRHQRDYAASTNLAFSRQALEAATSNGATREDYIDFVSNALLEPPPPQLSNGYLEDSSNNYINEVAPSDDDYWPSSDNNDWHNNVVTANGNQQQDWPLVEVDSQQIISSPATTHPRPHAANNERMGGGRVAFRSSMVDYNKYSQQINRSTRHGIIPQELGMWPTSRSATNNSNYNANDDKLLPMSGSERRASFQSYAPSQGATKRSRTMGGVVGSPDGVDDWYYTSSYGPATTNNKSAARSSLSSVAGRSTSGYNSSREEPSPTTRNNNVSNELQDDGTFSNQATASQRNFMTGRERRSTFTSFAPIPTCSRQGGVISSYSNSATTSGSSVATGRSSSHMNGNEKHASFNRFAQFEPIHGGGTGTEGGQQGVASNSSPAVRSATSSRSGSQQAVSSSSSHVSSHSESSSNNMGSAIREEAVRVKAQIDTLSGQQQSQSMTTSSSLDEAVEDDSYQYSYQDFDSDDAPIEDSVVPLDTPARQSLPPYLSLRPIPGKGLGVITNKPYFKGEFVGDYTGELMTEEVKDRRYLQSLQDKLTQEDREWIQSRLDRGQTLTGCYLYGVSLDDEDVHKRFFKRGKDKEEEDTTPKKRIYVDAEDEYESKWTRFINHASPPNNNVNPKSVPESYDGLPRVWFMANRDIEVGEELCFNYGDDYWLEGDEVF